jgi:IS30 family transposase
MKNYTHFSFEERKKIYYYLEVKLSINQIAKKLGRHRSAIYREINRNRHENKYIGSVADDIAKTRRGASRANKIKDNLLLNKYIFKRLQMGWSPEQIAGRMKFEGEKYYTCHESIYRYIYKEQKLEWYKYLHYKRKKRYRRCGRQSQVRYSGGKSIHMREAEIAGQFGHWEGDTIGFKGCKRNSITTLVERKTLLTLLEKNTTKSSEIVMEKIKDIIKNTPRRCWKTLCFDQGGEFADFRRIETETKCLVYYCDVKSPWQRGCNENTNGRIRKYLPKTADIETMTDDEIKDLSKKINKIPRKKLGYLMPKEAWALEFKTCCRT